ncbi:MAG: hypothetical protein MUD04_00160 [Cyanobium sp. Prado107]|nr:hypothetical protein [Cyanobium sp. Prado107]
MRRPRHAGTSCAGTVCTPVLVSVGIGLSLLLPMPAEAARYEAICGSKRCRIEVTDQGVKGPAGFIPADRIAQWNAVGWDNHNALVSSLGATGGALTGTVVGALATCWTLIACPFGILGGAVVGGVAGSRAGKTADYQFSVAGYDQHGNPLTETFRFIHVSPVRSLVENLTRVSGLEMGVRREVAIAPPSPRVPRPALQRSTPPLPAPSVPYPPTPQPAPAQQAAPPWTPPLAEQDRPEPGPLQSEMPVLYDAIDPYQGTPLFP